MPGFLSKEVAKGLAEARKRARRKKGRLRLHTGDQVYPILSFSDDALMLDAENAPHVRGLVDIYDGSKHLYQALIVASMKEGDMVRFEFKRHTRVFARAPVDFDRDENAPRGYLPKH